MLKKNIQLLALTLLLLVPLFPAHAVASGLAPGSSGKDVATLQQMLRAQGLFSYPTITGYFGDATKQAVIAFQETYAELVLVPLHLTHGTGFVGDLTAAALNASLTTSNATSSPTLTFYASHMTAPSGQLNTLLWRSTNTTSCTASGAWEGIKNVQSSFQVRPYVTTSYVLTCINGAQNVTGTVTVVVPDVTTAQTNPNIRPGLIPLPAVNPNESAQASTTKPNLPPGPPLPPAATTTPPKPSPVVSSGSYYVDYATGADTNAGTAKAPFKHSPGDINATTNPKNVTLKAGDTVFFKGGVRYYGSVIVNGSGTASNPVTLRGDGWGSGKAIIDGSDPIDSWTRCSSAPDCGGNANWTSMYKTTFTSVPSFLKAEPEIRLNLTQGEQVIIPAQMPLSTSRYYQNNKNYYSVPPGNVTTTSLRDSRLAALGGSALVGTYAYIWSQPNDIAFRKITSYNASTNTISFDSISPYTTYDTKYAIVNANTTGVFNAPGQYVFNLKTKTLYLWPLDGINPNGQVSVSTRAYGIDLSYQSHLVVTGFVLEKQTGDFTGSGAGIKKSASLDTQDITLSNNEVTLTQTNGYGAIAVARVTGLTIEGNYVHDILGNMRGIQITSSKDVLIARNRLRNIARTGIYFGAVTNGRMTSNIMTDSNSTHGNGLTAYQGSNNIIIDHNTVIDSNIAFTMESSSNVTIYNNVFDSSNHADKSFADWGGMTGTNRIMNNTVIGSTASAALYLGSKGGVTYYIANNIIGGGSFNKPGFTAVNNLYTSLQWNQSDRYGWKLGPGELISSGTASVLVNPEAGDYHLKPGSPAVRTGIPLPTYFTDDLAQSVRSTVGAWDIGAYAY